VHNLGALLRVTKPGCHAQFPRWCIELAAGTYRYRTGCSTVAVTTGPLECGQGDGSSLGRRWSVMVAGRLHGAL
jgi:hypothetical protein